MERKDNTNIPNKEIFFETISYLEKANLIIPLIALHLGHPARPVCALSLPFGRRF